MADEQARMSKYLAEDIVDNIDEVRTARGEYDSLDDRLDDIESGSFKPTQAQLAAINSGITDDDVEQIDLNKKNISYIENTGKKNWLKPNTISGVPTGMTFQYESDDSITINGTYSGSDYAYVFLHSFSYTAMRYTISCNVETTASTFYFYTRDGHMQTTQTLSYTYSNSGTTGIAMRIAPNTSFNNLNVKLMIRPSIITDPTYQPYSMSNTELTALIPKVASGTYILNNLTWTASVDGIIYSNATVVNGITNIYSAIITGFGRLRATDVIVPILSNDGTQIRFMANTNSWVTDAYVTLRIVGV